MTNPPPRPPNPSRSRRASPRPGLLARKRSAEPARFYLWPVFAALVVHFAVLAADSNWAAAVPVAICAAALFGATEAVRVSVYSINGHVQSLLQRDAAARLDQAAGW